MPVCVTYRVEGRNTFSSSALGVHSNRFTMCRREVFPVLVRRWFVHGANAAGRRKVKLPVRAVELWKTSDIVLQPPGSKAAKARRMALINPANEGLSGVDNFPYFPRGGQVFLPGNTPPRGAELSQTMASSMSWRGMDAGADMLYPAQVVDGVVRALGGKALAIACRNVPQISPGVRVATGSAVCTPPGSERLAELYQTIVHTVPPFYKQYANSQEADGLLLASYLSAFAQLSSLHAQRRVSWNDINTWSLWQGWRREGFGKEGQVGSMTNVSLGISLATPLIGAGTRGAPLEAATRVAALAAAEWLKDGEGLITHTPSAAVEGEEGGGEQENVLLFGVMDENIAEQLESALTRQFQR